MQVAGLLLTGGASTRMGRDKATLMIGDKTMAARVAEALCAVADPVLVVGHEAGTGLESIEDPHEGPLVAVAYGRRSLLDSEFDLPALVVACDLPYVTREVLAFIARMGEESGADVAVPVLDAHDQSLCAWYGTIAQDAAVRLSRAGERSMMKLIASLVSVRRIDEPEWTSVAAASSLKDADYPIDLATE